MIQKLLSSEVVRAFYGALVAAVIALSAAGVVDQDTVAVVIEAGVILGLGEFTRSQVYSRATAES